MSDVHHALAGDAGKQLRDRNEGLIPNTRKWRLIVSGIADEDALRGVLAHRGGELAATDEGDRFIWIPEFEQADGSAAVWEQSKQLKQRLARCSEVDAIVDLHMEIGPILELQTGGTWVKRQFIELGAATFKVTGGSLCVGDADWQRKHQRDAAITTAAHALDDPRVLVVMELLAIESPSGTQLGHIVDHIEAACNGDLSGFTSKAQRERFRRSINHPQVMGLDARHAISNEEPPPHPMSLSEAKDYAHQLARRWLHGSKSPLP